MITHTQYGFKPGSTTVDCLVDLIEEISTCLYQGDYAVSIFLDLSKAFDTVNPGGVRHEIRPIRMHHL